MRLISFIGTHDYGETTYVWTDSQGREHAYTTPYATVASARALEVADVAVLATDEARAKHGVALTRELDDVAPMEWVMIPSGANEAEMWEIYESLGDCVAPGQEIALDVTHGFRSLPLLVLLAAGFLRVARQVRVRHILYGAYDARDQSVTPSRTPVFDLVPMFALLEWANAADRFIRQGDARDLAELLRREKPPYTAQQADPDIRAQSIQIATLATSLDEVSANLLLSRPHRAMEAAANLTSRLGSALDLPAASQPFLELLDQVTEAFSWLALPRPTARENLWGNLARQRRLIHWYADRGHWVHACTLAREWVVSWRLVQTGGLDLQNKDAREAVEGDLGTFHGADKAGGAMRARIDGVPRTVNLGRLWGRLTHARNRLAHVVDYPGSGKQASAIPTDLIGEIKWCIEQIDQFKLPNPD